MPGNVGDDELLARLVAGIVRGSPVLSGFRDVLDERRAAGAAAGSFTCYDVTTACGVVHAAEAAGVPVVLLVSEASVASRDGRLLLPALGAIARSARVPVCVQLDHEPRS